MKQCILQHFGKGILLQIPVVIVSCFIAGIFSILAGIVGAIVFATFLGLIACAILCYLTKIVDPIPIETDEGIPYRKIVIRFLPFLAISVVCLVVLILISTLDIMPFSTFKVILSAALGASASHWLMYWAALLSSYKNISCDKCHYVFCFYDRKVIDHHSGTGELTKTHSGSGIVGHVYNEDGEKVGDIKGDTSYTTTHRYYYTNQTLQYRCKHCGAKKEFKEHNTTFIN